MTSVKVALAATAVALVLGTLAAFALQRYKFFGRYSISFLLILPIALPGIVTGRRPAEHVQPHASTSACSTSRSGSASTRW